MINCKNYLILFAKTIWNLEYLIRTNRHKMNIFVSIHFFLLLIIATFNQKQQIRGNSSETIA